MDEFLTHTKANIGPDNNSTAYVCGYIYICAVESKLGPRFALFWVTTWSKVASKPGPRFCLLVFPLLYSVFGIFKILKWRVGVRKYLFAGCRRVKKEFSKKWAFFVFFCGEKEKGWKKWKRKNTKTNRKLCSGVVVNQKGFVKMASSRNIGKHYLCSECKERTFLLTLSVLENVTFL